MTGRQWIDVFIESLYELREFANDEGYNRTDGKWTEFMVEKVINEGMSIKIGCQVISLLGKDSERRQESGEYLNMDAMFIEDSAYDGWRGLPYYDPPVIPDAVVEHENSQSGTFAKIQYCMWKLFCLRSGVRILICYRFGFKKIQELKNGLEMTIKKNNLAEVMGGEFVLIVGDQSKDDAFWRDRLDIINYFKIFQWNNIMSTLSPVDTSN